MHLSPPSYALPVCLLTLLAACGGGGGGGGGGPVDVQFTSFAAIAPNQRANMTGISQTTTGDLTLQPDGTVLLNSVAPVSPVDTANTRAQITFDGNRNISAFSFTAPQSSASFSSGVDCSAEAGCVANTATSVGVIGNPSFPAHNWNYQTYGVWFVQSSATAFQIGVLSVGAATPATAVPNTDTAVFTGFTSGFYRDHMGQPFVTSALVSANVDFGASPKTIAFSTSNMTIANVNTQVTSTDAMGGLNLSGTLTYNAGTNQFGGTLMATTNSLTGPATGRFYGPAAQEMGGVYSLTGNTGSTMIGAFGARRP